MESIRSLIVGAYPLWSNAVAAALDLEPGVDVVAWGRTGEAAALVERHRPVVLVVGTVRLARPLSDMLRGVVRGVAAVDPGCRVVAVNLSAEPAVARLALAAGASGFVAADDDVACLGAAVREVGAGRPHVSPAAAAALAREAGSTARLTVREIEVLDRIPRGWSSADVADDLHLAVRTVEAARQAIARKIGVRSRREVVDWAIARGIVA